MHLLVMHTSSYFKKILMIYSILVYTDVLLGPCVGRRWLGELLLIGSPPLDPCFSPHTHKNTKLTDTQNQQKDTNIQKH